MAKLLINTATGPSDPTRASLAFHIAVNGGVPAGAACSLVLMGDATELIKPGVADGIRGVGIPPLRELLDKCRQAGLTFYV